MLEEILRAGFAELGLPPVDEGQLAAFRGYYELLREAGEKMNLTAIHGEAESARLHFLDSAAPLLLFRGEWERAAVVDVGSGAGFPGLPLRLLCPGLRLTLLDSQGKRIRFLEMVCASLGLEDVSCVHIRAEEWSEGRERYDFALSRAVARLNLLCELCLPLVRPGGAFLAMKGPALAEELPEAERAISRLGGKLEQVFPYTLPGGESGDGMQAESAGLRRNIAVIRKISPTPRAYPRPFARIKKSPL